MIGNRFRIGPALGLVLSMVVLNGAIASAQTWTGGGADDFWTDNANWSTPPANDGSAPIHMAGTTRLTSDVDTTPWSIKSLTFDSSAGAFTLFDQALTIGSGGVTNNSTNAQIIDNAVTLAPTSPQTWNAVSGNLTFGSTVNLNGNILTIDGPNNTTISDTISDSAGGGSLTKNGAGTLFLGGNNSAETGTVTLNAGTIQASATNALLGGAYTITGGTLNFNGMNSNLGAVTNSGGAITLNGATSTIASLTQSSGSFSTGTSGTATVTGALALNGGTFDVTGGSATVGSLTGTSSSANLILGSNGTFTDTTAGTDTYVGIITSSGGTFVLNGTGNLTLSGDNVDSFGSGNVTVTSGTLTAGASNALPVANYSVDGTVNVNNNTLTVTGLTSTGATGQITLGTGTLDITDTGTSVYGGGVSGGTGSTIDMEAGTQTINGVVSGQTAITANGGTLTLGGTNTYSGGTTLNTGGTVSVSSDDNLGGASSALTFNGGTLEVTGTTLTSLATTHTINTSTFNGGFDIDSAGNTFTVSQTLSGSGALSKSGDGTLVLTGTNTYSGGTNVTDGTLQGTTTSLQGDISTTSPGTVDFNQTTNGTYAGAISGTGNAVIDANSSTITFTGTNTYSGTTTIDSGTLQIGNAGTTGALGTGAVTDNGTLVFDHTDSVTAANAIGGGGNLTQMGTGLLTLSGVSNYSGATNVNAGQLNVDGSITSATTVASSATLGGIGTISNDVSNSGTLTPGNSSNLTGTLSVTGTYTFAAAGTTMNVSVNDNNAQNVSQLAVTGNVQLDASKLHIDLSSGNFDKTGATQYTFLTATGGVGGSFASADTTSIFVTATLHPEANDIFFTLANNFAAPGVTFNQIQVGNYLTANAANTNTDFQALITALNGITDASEARAALTQLSGDIHPTLAQLTVNDTNIVIGQIAARLRAAPFTPGGPLAVADGGTPSRPGSAPIALVSAGPDGEPELQSSPDDCGNHWSGWGIGYGMGGSADSDGNATGASFGMGGIVAGLERWEDDCHLVGFYGAYVGAGANTENGQNASINGGQFGAYVFADDGFNYYTLLGGFEFDGDTTNRNLSINGLTSGNTSDYTDWQSFVYAERGMSFQECNYVVQPFAAVQYIFLRQNGFTETGGSNTAVNLDGSSDTTNSLRSMVGARLQYAMVNHAGRRTLPEIHAMWLHEYLDSDTSLTATMVPVGGSPFIVRGLDMGRDWGVVGASFTWEMLDGWSMFVNYDMQTNTQVTYHTGSGGLGYRW